MKALPRLTAGLIALCALLAAALALLWLLPNGQGRLRHAWVAPSAQAPALDSLAVPLPSPAPLPLASYAVTLQRPLFTESRRPLPAADANKAAQAAPPPDDLEKFQLLGLMTGPSFVGVMARVDGKVRTVRQGEAVGPWTLHAIRDRDVVFTQDGRERVLKLDYAHATASVSAPAGPVAAPTGPATQGKPAPAAPAKPAPATVAPPAPVTPSAPVTPPAPVAPSNAPTSRPAAQPGGWTIGGRPVRSTPPASAPTQ